MSKKLLTALMAAVFAVVAASPIAYAQEMKKEEAKTKADTKKKSTTKKKTDSKKKSTPKKAEEKK